MIDIKRLKGERRWVYHNSDLISFYVNMDVIKILDKSLKLITSQLKTDSDIIQYRREQETLKGSIDNIFGNFDVEIQCQIAYLHLGENIKDFGLLILNEMRGNGAYDFEEFFARLFKLVFPASQSAMEVKYRDLAQNDMTIGEYAKTFQSVSVAKGLGNIEFILGLNDKEIRKVLCRVDVTKYSFQELIEYASSLENHLYLERVGKEPRKRFKQAVQGGRDSGAKVSLDYYQLAGKKGLKRGLCYNCLTAFHSCTACPRMKCQFCGRENKEVKHFSLGCPRCPDRV